MATPETFPEGVVAPDYGADVELFEHMPRDVDLANVSVGGVVHIQTQNEDGSLGEHLAFRRYADNGRGEQVWTQLHDVDDVVLEEPVVLVGACLTPYGNVSESLKPGVRRGAYFEFMTYAPLRFRSGTDVPRSEYVLYETPEQLAPDIRDAYLASGMVERGEDGLLYWRMRGHRNSQVTAGRVLLVWVELPEQANG